MALSEQQKAGNAAANAIKRKAHYARCKAISAAILAAERSPEVLEAKAAADSASVATKAAVAERAARVKALTDQIAALEEQIKGELGTPGISDTRAIESAAWSAWRNLREAKVDEAKSAFPDMAGYGRLSIAAWVPPPDTQAEMDAARAAVDARYQKGAGA